MDHSQGGAGRDTEVVRLKADPHPRPYGRSRRAIWIMRRKSGKRERRGVVPVRELVANVHQQGDKPSRTAMAGARVRRFTAPREQGLTHVQARPAVLQAEIDAWDAEECGAAPDGAASFPVETPPPTSPLWTLNSCFAQNFNRSKRSRRIRISARRSADLRQFQLINLVSIAPPPKPP